MIELSPSQERKLLSILDRGLDTLNGSSEKSTSSSPFLQKLSNKPQDSHLLTPSQNSEKTQVLNSELKSLQEKLTNLEARLASNPNRKPLKIQTKSPVGNLKPTTGSTPRSTSSLSRKKNKREKIRKIEDVEKEIEKIERSITPSPARFNRNKYSEGTSGTKDKDSQGRLKRENEILKGEIKRMEIALDDYQTLKRDYESLMNAFEKSEKIRKKQKDLILKLKGDLRSFYN